mgnify:CR=1 FL=1
MRNKVQRDSSRIPRDYHQEWMERQREKHQTWEREVLELESLLRHERMPENKSSKIFRDSDNPVV